ncbi:hypothetical protein ACVWYH_000117 [Bradyrhizobium sp. GM24.11]
MIALLSENRVRPNVLRSERYESDSGREQPRGEPKKSGNKHYSASMGCPRRGSPFLRLDFKSMFPPPQTATSILVILQQILFVRSAEGPNLERPS